MTTAKRETNREDRDRDAWFSDFDDVGIPCMTSVHIWIFLKNQAF